MKVEIYGARFVNKGAEMMLYAIVNKIKEQYPDAKFVLSCSSKEEFDLLTQKGFYKRITYRKHILDLGDLGRFIPKSVRQKNNIVLEKEIDILFEASGFAYGDQWTYRMANYVAKKFKKFKKNKTKLVVMPQALGPFINPLNNKYTTCFLNLADYVFVRDKQSLEYVKGLDIKHNNVKLMPDFTILLKPKVEEKYILLKDNVLIVPNKKVITTSKLTNIEELYTEMLKEIVLRLKNRGIKVTFLIHEGIGDYQVAEIVNAKLPKPIEIIWEKDIYKLKGIISQSKALIGSRFHSLVSSLSQAIPSIAIGWSHKYNMLFQDFSSDKNIFKVDDRKDVYLNKVDEFFTDYELLSEKENLLNQSDVQKEKVEQMWKIIFEEIIQ